MRDIALVGRRPARADKLGGPSVFPPQPEGATSLAYGQSPWPVSTGPDRYRRGLYTYLKRTAPYAASITMDAPTSETTCVRRDRSNTPLQALTLLNDAVFVEAAQALARRILVECPDRSTDDRVRHAFRLCLTRLPGPRSWPGSRPSTNISSPGSVRASSTRPGSPARRALPSVAGVADELAAWTTVARVLLNLDETVTKE